MHKYVGQCFCVSHLANFDNSSHYFIVLQLQAELRSRHPIRTARRQYTRRCPQLGWCWADAWRHRSMLGCSVRLRSVLFRCKPYTCRCCRDSCVAATRFSREVGAKLFLRHSHLYFRHDPVAWNSACKLCWFACSTIVIGGDWVQCFRSCVLGTICVERFVVWLSPSAASAALPPLYDRTRFRHHSSLHRRGSLCRTMTSWRNTRTPWRQLQEKVELWFLGILFLLLFG